MSTETAETISIRVRQRLRLPQEWELKFQPLVDVCLRRLAYDCAIDPKWSNYLQTDRATATVTLDADGIADLTALMANPRILLEALPYGEIYPPVAYENEQPFRLVENRSQLLLSGAYDQMFFHACVIGSSLETKDVGGEPMAGVISFSTTFWPTLTNLPELLVEKLVMHPYWEGVVSQHEEAKR